MKKRLGANGYKLDDVQKIQLGLLAEIEDMCTGQGISYSICGALALDFLKHGCITAPYHNIEIAMTPSNFDKWLRVVNNRRNLKNRWVESMLNSVYYPGLGARFYDTRTLFLRPLSSNFKGGSIFITIRIARPCDDQGIVYGSKGPVRSFLKSVTYHFRSAPTQLKRLVYPLFQVYGFISRKDWERLLEVDIRGGAESYIIDSKDQRVRVRLSKGSVGRTAKVSINGVSARISDEIYRHPKQFIPDIDYRDVKLVDEWSVVSSANISYDDYLKTLPVGLLAGLRFNRIKEQYYMRKMRKIEQDSYSHHKYLLYVAYHFYGFKFKKVFRIRWGELSKLAKDGRFAELETELSDYIEYFEYFYERGRILAPDEDILGMLIGVLRHRGNDEFADIIQTKVISTKTKLSNLASGEVVR